MAMACAYHLGISFGFIPAGAKAGVPMWQLCPDM